MKYIKTYEKIDKRYIVIGRSVIVNNALYLRTQEGYTMLPKDVSSIREDDDFFNEIKEKIFTSKIEAQKDMRFLKRELNRDDIFWSVEEYAPYELKWRIAKKYNL